MRNIRDSAMEGFTLLEVLVALAIACLILLLLFHVSVEALVATTVSVDKERAITIAESSITEACYGDQLRANATVVREFDKFHVETNVSVAATERLGNAASSTVLGGQKVTLYSVHVNVSWGGEKRTRTWSLQTSCLIIERV